MTMPKIKPHTHHIAPPMQGRLEVFGGSEQNIKVALLIIKKKHNFFYKKKPHQFKLQLK
jgi:hypothetical protein